MRITDLLPAEAVQLNTAPSGQDAAIDALIALHAAAGDLSDPALYRRDVLAREAQGPTAIGAGIAIPHAKSAAVRRPGLSAMTAPDGVDCHAPDGTRSNLFFMIAAPIDGADVHLDILARLMKLLMHEDFRSRLLAAKTTAEFLSAIDEKEREAFPDEYVAPPEPALPQVLAVTACPTGIAHTYMAAEALERKAAELGIRLKAETQGSAGTQNALTPAEIAACEGIIVAADRDVDLARFDARPVLRVPVGDGINRPGELIQKVLDGAAPVYRHAGGPPAPEEPPENAARVIYKQLMNGVSHMLPFVIGGGILIALSFLIDDPTLGYGTFGSNTPWAAWLSTVGHAAFDLMLPILAGYIAMSIADRPGLMVGIAGGMLAISGQALPFYQGEAVSAGFLGAVLAGFAAGYLMRGLKHLCSRLPWALEGIKPVLIYPLAGLLLTGAIVCLVNPFVGMLNSALYTGLEGMGEGSKIALGAVLAGMMAIDMGGPFNKAAYLFGTSTLAAMAATGGSDVMAAVMVGGMVPPLSVALCCTFFQNRFTPDARKSGMVNYILGLCFITEGAVPFAAADPLRVIPSCIAGSAVAGALSMFFGCTLPAPHGGIFVFPVMGNILGYIAALSAGAVVGMLALAVLKKKKTEESKS